MQSNRNDDITELWIDEYQIMKSQSNLESYKLVHEVYLLSIFSFVAMA